MPAPTIDELPSYPNPNDPDRANFNAEAYAFTVALGTLVDQINSFGAFVGTDIDVTKTIRTPEDIAALPDAATRANKFLAFGADGEAALQSYASTRTLLNVADGATANATNAQLRDRATHTGTQAMSTIVGLSSALDAKLDDTQIKTSLASPDNSNVPSTLAVASAIAAVSSGEFPQGAWNASTNIPALASSVGTAGYSYEVSVAGATNLNGESGWQVGDKAIFNGIIWTRVPASAVKSIDGRTGAVKINYDTVADLASASISVGAKVSTKGCLSIGDGGEGNFIISATATTAEDGYSCFEIANGNYAVLQPFGGVLHARQLGVVADGTTDNNAALQRLATAAKNMSCPVQLGEGQILSLGGQIEWQHPVVVTGMGAGKTALIFESMGGYAGENGFDLTIDSGRYETSSFANFTMQVKGANGAYGISTPMGGAIFGYRPKIVCTGIVFKGFVESGTIGLFDYTWQRCLSIGDGLGHNINNCEFFGNYDYTLDPAGQNLTASAIYLSCIEDEGGMTMPKIDHCFTQFCATPVHLGFRVSNATISFSQFHRSYWGIYSPNPFLGANYGNDETYLYGLNINSQRNCVYSAGGGFFSMHGVRATRSAGGFDHAEGWTAFDMNDMIDLKMYDTRAYNAGTYSNPMIGYKFSNVERITGSGFFHRGDLDIGIQIDEPEYVAIHGLQYENGTTDVGISLDRSVITSSDINISGFMDAGLVTTRYQFSGTVTRRQVRDLDAQNVYNSVVVSSTAITTAGTTTLTVGADDQVQRFACGTGAGIYTRDFTFSNTGAKEGDTFLLNISQVDTNPTVTITDGAGVVLLTIPPTGSTQRHAIELVHNGSQWRIIRATASLA